MAAADEFQAAADELQAAASTAAVPGPAAAADSLQVNAIVFFFAKKIQFMK